MSEAKNCIIKSTMLGVEDHGILSLWITLEGDGWSCGFGGYALDEWSEAEDRRVGTAYGCEFIKRVLETLDASSWEKLPGKYLRAKTGGLGRTIEAIGHPIKEKWFDPKAFYEEFKNRGVAK